MKTILDLPAEADMVRFAADFGQRFIVTVDTEEEFDWGQPFSRTGFGLDHVPHIAEFQTFCESFGVSPIYLVDYPIATDPRAAEVMGGPIAAGKAEAGVQLHPWVSPPFEETVSVHNSFSGNLPRELERAKFNTLRDAIETGLGSTPRIYRAGRYGVGTESAHPGGRRHRHRHLGPRAVRLQFRRRPQLRDHPLTPYWIDRAANLMELPLTTVFWGMLRKQGRTLYPMLWRVPRLRGLLARWACWNASR
jgi:hypothetical protein